MLEQTLERKVQRIYRMASVVATVEACFLFILGLDLTSAQILLFILFGCPAPVVMYGLDRWLIGRHVQPIQTALDSLQTGRPREPRIAAQGWIQALNLPTLTLLRVLTVHAPSVLLPLTGHLLLANQVAGLGFAWWQFIILWLFWPITAVPHAIVEYFLIERVSRPIMAWLAQAVHPEVSLFQRAATAREIFWMTAGMTLPAPRIISEATAAQLGPGFLLGQTAALPVRGKAQPVRVVEVLGYASDCARTIQPPLEAEGARELGQA
jgi:hypothetical protein